MSASQESRLASIPDHSHIEKLGIFAGGGALPRLLYQYCLDQEIEPVVIGFQAHAHPEHFNAEHYIESKIATSGSILKNLKARDVRYAVFVGSIERPSLLSMIPDWTTLHFFLTKGIWAKGDNAILIAAKKFLYQKAGITLHGVHQFLPNLLMPEGCVSKAQYTDFKRDIDVGLKASQELGQADIGQAVLVKNGHVIGREDKKGTNTLIRRYGEEGAVLVKTCKPQQDLDLDLPTIGIKTVEQSVEAKLAGIVAHAEKSLFLDQEEAIKLANENNLFITGAQL
ncbi:MAG: UDP-2,3-diacylglucosamine diphosphatase LpxI [Pseudomonadota bacterium]